MAAMSKKKKNITSMQNINNFEDNQSTYISKRSLYEKIVEHTLHPIATNEE